jgi:hypothetical protein
MSEGDHYVVRDIRGRELGTVTKESPYSSGPAGPLGLALIGTFFLVNLGVWIVGGIVLTIVIQVVTKIFGSANVGESASLGFSLAYIIGFLAACAVVINILRKKEERQALVRHALIGGGALAAFFVVYWAFVGR